MRQLHRDKIALAHNPTGVLVQLIMSVFKKK